MEKFDHAKIEKETQERWEGEKLYEIDLEAAKDPYYVLFEFPYPSGDLHIGHWYAFALTDIFARFKRMQGKDVFFPVGFDSFGLPAENAAIKNGADPKEWTYKNIDRMRAQMRSMGTSVDWSKEIAASDPEYYRWTQWLFGKLYEHGLAERRLAPVKWCPKDQTVLANEQVIDGKCERCGSEVEEKNLTQWFFKITKYAKRLLEDLDRLPWREDIKEAQRAWIGESEGARLRFAIREAGTPRFLLLHGREESPKDAYLPWLKSELEKCGYEVEVPQLPNPEEPDAEEQADFIEKHCRLDRTTIVIGHSFGGIVALRLLERGHQIRRLIAAGTPVSGTFLDGKERRSVADACAKSFRWEVIRENAEGFTVLADKNDTIVPASDADVLAGGLGIRPLFIESEETHFCGSREPAILAAALPFVDTFTTRPDTVYGTTYLVLAPEHPLVGTLAVENRDEVNAYVAAVKKKTERERLENKEKTGVELKGVKVLNPATKEEIPVYIADYVLSGYGTGAVMAVPFHDERDFEFAKLFGLPMKQVVMPVTGEPHEGEVRREGGCAIVFDPNTQRYAVLKRNATYRGLCSGGVDEGEDIIDGILREVREESGLHNFKYIEYIGSAEAHYYNALKDRYMVADAASALVILENAETVERKLEAHEVFETEWVTALEIRDEWRAKGGRNTEHWLWFLSQGVGRAIELGYDTTSDPKMFFRTAYMGDGTLISSDDFNGRNNREAFWDIVASVGGERVTNYRIRDWLVSRQRYWGCPIPVVYDPEGNPHLIPSEHLPWLLPSDVDFTPTGKSPLATSTELTERVTKLFGEGWTPEYDTFDTFVDSSWYFLRYLDPNDEHAFSDQGLMKKWLPVDRYSGGSEHTTMHLLYARFFHKALYDLALVPTPEPFDERYNRGLILGSDGQKMSKRWGNVVNPDEMVSRFGADAVRMYLAFVGPYNEPGSYPWNLDGVVSMRKFLDRIYTLASRVSDTADTDLLRARTDAIQKVVSDTERFKFNTAISALMVFVRELEKMQTVPADAYRELLILLAPYAPHLAEHLWGDLGEKGSVHQARLPEVPDDAGPETVTMAVQVNGKKRGEVVLSPSASEEEALLAAKGIPAVSEALGGTLPTRTIYVPGRILNLVVDKV